MSSFTPHPGDREPTLTPVMREAGSNPWSLNLSKVSVSQHKLALYTHGPECRPRNNTSSPSPLRGLLLGLIGYERHCVLETAHVTGNLPRLSGRRRAPGMLDGPYSGSIRLRGKYISVGLLQSRDRQHTGCRTNASAMRSRRRRAYAGSDLQNRAQKSGIL